MGSPLTGSLQPSHVGASAQPEAAVDISSDLLRGVALGGGLTGCSALQRWCVFARGPSDLRKGVALCRAEMVAIRGTSGDSSDD